MIRSAGMLTSVVMCLFGLCAITGCGGGGEDSSARMAPTSSDSGSEEKLSESDASASDSSEDVSRSEDESGESEESTEFGSIVGTIKVTGELPELPPLVKKGDQSAKDPAVCAAQAVPNETLVVGEGNGVANVFIWLRNAPKGAVEADVPDEPIVFDQQGCKFVPHALVLHTSQKIKAVSSDGVAHNVHTYPVNNNGFNQTISPNDKTGLTIEYPEAEYIPIRVTCDFHTWMTAWHFPVDHPYAALTDENGRFQIKNLPAGTHELRIWHEKDGTGGYLEKGYEVTVEAGEATQVNLEYSVGMFGH